MVLTTTVEQALRALTHLAAMPEDSLILGRDLAKSARVPPNYLAKILWTLGRAGIIDAMRGTGGGYKLGRKAGEIRLIEIVGLFDPAHLKTACLLGHDKDCSNRDACPVHATWVKLRDAHLGFLSNTTIADIARSGRRRGGSTRKSK